MKNQLTISDADKKILLHLLQKHLPDTEAWAYGSRVTGKARPASDLDLVVFASPEQAAHVGDLREAFEESDLTFRVDLFVWDSVPESFRANIEKEHVVLHGADNEELQAHVRQWGKVLTLGATLPVGWEFFPIDALKANEHGSIAIGPFGSRMKSDCYVPSGVKVVRGTNLSASRYFSGEFVCITEEKAAELGSANLQPNDLVFPHRGSIGEVGLVPCDGEKYVLSSSLMKLKCDRKKVNPFFLFYFFTSKNGKFELLKNASQVGTPGIGQPLTSLKQINVLLPSIKEQNAIANFLSRIDDRIQLLRETNATLEAMAQALFKSWFVDFDPVHAKAEGRAPEGMDAETAALFPAEFEESELGMIPKGWKYASLSEAYEINPRRKMQKNSSAKYLDMSSVGVQGHSVANVILRSVGSGSKFQNGDTLLARITPCLENGKTAFVDFLENGETGWGSTEFVVLRPKMPLPEYHGYLLARYPAFRSFAIQSMSGTSGRQRIQNDALASFQIVVPASLVCKAFEKIVAMVQKKITANHEHTRTLTALRDTLLPRLISGKLRLPEFDGPENGASA